MKNIWKCILKIDDEQIVELPEGAEALTVQIQDGQPCLWYLVNPVQPLRKYLVRMAGTGHPIERNYSKNEYVGTFQMKDGQLIFHVFIIQL